METLTLAQIVVAFTEHLEGQFNGPELMAAVHKGTRDGRTVGEFTYHCGKPEYVTTAEYGFQWDEYENRVILYFI